MDGFGGFCLIAVLYVIGAMLDKRLKDISAAIRGTKPTARH